MYITFADSRDPQRFEDPNIIVINVKGSQWRAACGQ